MEISFSHELENLTINPKPHLIPQRGRPLKERGAMKIYNFVKLCAFLPLWRKK
jgi:hypothetical protein